MSQAIVKKFKLGDGREVSIETGRLAKQAAGAVVVKMEDTMLLATVLVAPEPMENADFFPLTVEYKEKYSATGKFPGGFFKREARPSEYEILISRLVDRALRPLFPDNFYNEIQVQVMLISGDKKNLPDTLVALAASSAIMVSNIPFLGPISEARVARINGEFEINPPIARMEEADLDLIVAATMDNVVMVEGQMKEVSEAVMLNAIKFAHEAIKQQCQAQIELAEMVEAAREKMPVPEPVEDKELETAIHEYAYPKFYDIARQGMNNKHQRHDAFSAVKEAFIGTIPEEKREELEPMISRYFEEEERNAVRNCILDDRIRLDGRGLEDIRPIWCEVDYLPAAHGSAIFTRGETQALVTVTLGTKLDEQVLDGAVVEGKSDFMLHYNFPGFSTGEVKPIRGTSRREIGHGNLAMRAIKPMIPADDINPYTVRIVSDILESNGSSSMASVCGGTLALMDAGVKIHKPVSGIAMGLITDPKSGKYAVLSDILGDEDHLGDMDFKVTGTVDGITACQMDIKIEGLSYEIMEQALEQAKRGRHHILGEMLKTIDSPRPDYKPHVPRIEKMTIPKEFIGAVIGPGGKIIQEIQKDTGSTIIIEEVGDVGVIDIFSGNKESIEAAKERIRKIVAIPEVGEIYNGKVKSIVAFGAFVEILPGKEGLLHISEIDWKRVTDIDQYMKVGQMLEVKLIGIDNSTGKLKLSRKALIPQPPQKQ
ncbi:MAG TPA: polyribonucleotide nucleotidyltransferase [Bacteroidales bacterium]|nr:polyribonucleotide nucleotidyltransferase [Bacteroidales bacterium]HOX77466.1 polyribonucleotide nucleotidyltransferase [Bacteroidales bacterium]HPI84796.1 polyribonucleotide nucleotidyltransferase [Bacteroidales bacterium]HPM91979.1 polyribonucleotide nucleotidyltransferase [Bacteroidales bacterium]